MGLPRIPKIERIPVPRHQAPDWTTTLGLQDPYGLGPQEPWLQIDNRRFPKPDRLQRLVDGAWVDEGEGTWRIHAFVRPDRAIVSQDQQRLLAITPDGARHVLWEGPRLVENTGGALWGDNWMFAAAGLPDGRWVAAVPDTDDPDRDERTWVQKLVLRSAEDQILAELVTPERSNSAVSRGMPRRFMVRDLYPGCEGRVVVLCDTDVLAVGVYDDRLTWIGKTTMPRLGGGVWLDGTEVLVSTSLSDEKVSWRSLDGLQALWERKR